MINPFAEINWNPQQKDLRNFGKIVMTGLLIFAVIFYSTGSLSLTAAACIAAAGLLCLILSYSIPAAARPVYYLWFALGATIGIIISNLALALFYYIVLTPVALAIRLFSRRDPLGLKSNTNGISNWRDCQKVNNPNRYFKQY